MANEIRDLAARQEEATRALGALTAQLRRTSEPGSEVLGPRAPAAHPAESRSDGLEQALRRAAGSLEGVGTGLASNTAALRESSTLAAGLLSGTLKSVLGGLGKGGELGGLLKSGLGLGGLAGGLVKLFGGSKKESEPQTLESFSLPQPVRVEAANGPLPGLARTVRGVGDEVRAAPQVVVNVSAMDSQSFMDRSDDIARAVRSAMLHMHPLNDVVDEI